MQLNRRVGITNPSDVSESLAIAPPCPSGMIGSMVHGTARGVDRARVRRSARKLYEEHRIEVPIFSGVNELRRDARTNRPPCGFPCRLTTISARSNDWRRSFGIE